MSRKNKRRKEEICEDYCFSCKDGGTLIICDYRDCLKAYHTECAGKDDTFLDSGERWKCRWHSCFICNKFSKFYCLCCPQAVCGRCIYDAEFVLIKGNKGLCQDCLKLALLIEDGSPADSEGVKVDFTDDKTYEFFFVGYWEYIREKEGLNRECVHSANEILKNNKNFRSDLYFLEIGKIEENVGESEEESHHVVSDYGDSDEVDEYKPGKRRSESRRNSRNTKKKENSKKKEFVGWGSKSLLEFLDSVDQDTSKPIEEYEVVSVVMKYCVENKLFDPKKRKRIICDEMLRSLFGKQFVLKNSLNKLLAPHFASNSEQSTGDGPYSSSDDEEVNLKITRRESSVSPQQTQKEKKVNPDVQKSCYALVSTENIKLVYLKRSLVEELLKHLEDFGNKVVGSFVRVKCNPNDYLQKNSHQLLQVKGVTASSNGQILLRFTDCPDDFPVCKLSDEDFTEEECEDLRNRIKDGALKKPTVVELEQKARSLHKDMINHWIPKELAFLRRRIDQANEKGWRREMSEYIDRIQLLSDESERQRLLNKFPEIIAEPVVQDSKRDCDSPESPDRSASPHFLDSDFSSENFSCQSETEDQNNQSVTSTSEKPPKECRVPAPEVGENTLEEKLQQPVLEINGSCCKTLFLKEPPKKPQASTSDGQTNMNIRTQLQSSSSSSLMSKGNSNQLHDQQATMENQSTSKVEVIQLSDDEPEEFKVETKFQPLKDIDSSETRELKNRSKEPALKEIPRTSNPELLDSSCAKQYRKVEIRHQSLGDAKSSLWYCRSALGHKAGPFKMSSLKNCFETKDQEFEIKVWKKGWSEEDAILLEDAIRQIFPGT